MRSNSLADANLDVAAASARLRQSRAERRVAGAAELPTLAAAEAAAYARRGRARRRSRLGRHAVRVARRAGSPAYNL